MLQISLDGNSGIEVELETSSRRLRTRYYTGGPLAMFRRNDMGSYSYLNATTGLTFVARRAGM